MALLAISTGSVRAANAPEYRIPAKGLTVTSSSAPAPAYQAQTSTNTLAFGGVVVGQSLSRQVLFSNVGTSTLSLLAPSTSGAGFSTTTTCASTLAAGESCLAEITFTPVSGGSATGQLTFGSNASGAPHVVALTGSGLQAAGALTATTSSDFGSLTLGSSANRAFTFNNTGDAPATGTYATLTGTNLTLSANTCGTQASPVTLAAGASCSMTVTYSPLSVGALSGAELSVTSSAGNSPSALSLTGTATSSSVVLNFNGTNGSTSFTDAGTPGISWTSVNGAQLSTSLYREGSASLALDGVNQGVTGAPINLTGDFTVSAWIRPTGPLTSQMPIIGQWRQTAGQGGWFLTVRGNGQAGFFFGPYSEASPLVSSSQQLTSNTWQHVAVTRVGSTFTLYVNGVASGSAVYAGAGRSLSVNAAIGNYYADTGAFGGVGPKYFPGNIDGLYINNGAGIAPSAPTLSTLSGSAPSFATTAVGSSSSAATLQLTNSGSAPVTLASLDSSSSEFVLGSTAACVGVTLAPGASCSVSVVFSPISAGTRSASVTAVSTDASNSPYSVNLSATASASIYTLNFEGPNNATSVADSNGITWTATGAANLSTAKARSGTASLAPSGSNTGVFAGPTIRLPSGDFTVEAWVYPTASNTDALVVGQYVYNTSAQTGWGIMLKGTTPYFCGIFSAWTCGGYSAPALALNTWSHVAVTRASGTVRMFVNGVLTGSATVSGASQASATGPTTVGGYSSYSGSAPGALNAYIDDVTIDTTKAKYTANFTPQ